MAYQIIGALRHPRVITPKNIVVENNIEEIYLNLHG
jgi:hypothetical protein